MTRRAFVLPAMAVSLIGLALLATAKFTTAETDRTDCPGKIVCPETGELVCRDRCPTVDPDRQDCPGRIVCPINGKLVCIDRCPLGASDAEKADANTTPPCCTPQP